MILQENFLGAQLSKMLKSFHSAELDGHKSLKQKKKMTSSFKRLDRFVDNFTGIFYG